MQCKRRPTLFSAILIITLGCKVGDDIPATKGSHAEEALTTLKQVSKEAKAVNAAALSLESLIDDGRRRISKGESKETVIREIREHLEEVERQNTEMQATLRTFETQLKSRKERNP